MVKILKLLDIKIELAKSCCKLGLLTRKVFFAFIIFNFFGGSQFPSFSIINEDNLIFFTDKCIDIQLRSST